jgi:hypothetical protein
MKRREFVGKVGIGSAALVAGGALAKGLATPAAAKSGAGHDHSQVDGPLASATVSFGQWPTETEPPVPPVDRFPNVGAPARPNVHLQIPYIATIKEGGSVNFVVAGFHNIQIFEPGTKTTDINVGMTIPVTNPPPPPAPSPFPPLINDANGRVYRGPDPTLVPQDRVEAVRFTKPGKYLVICGFIPHFVNDNMHGFVNVLPSRGGRDDRDDR